MTQSIDNRKQNIDLIYTYAENLVKIKTGINDDLNRRLTTFLGFSSALIALGSHLEDEIFHTKIAVIGIAIVAICFIARALTANPAGGTPEIDVLLKDEVLQMAEQDLKEKTIRTWEEGIKEIESLENLKVKSLNCSIWLLVIGVFLSGVSIAIRTFT